MGDLTLYRKYRPSKFSEIYGQNDIKTTLINALKYERLSHAYLFNGPRGVGKTTIARIIAKSLNCLNNTNLEPCNECENCRSITLGNFIDLIEIDAASNRGIDEIRELKENAGYLPVKGMKKIYIIDEVHMLTKEAFNALLKLLEEPPKHILFILATTEIDKIPDTVISRTQRFDFKTISENDIINMLLYVSDKEKINISKEALKLIFKKSEGSARDAFSIFEKVISNYINFDEITLDMTQKALGVISDVENEKFLNFFLDKEKDKIIKFLDKLWLNGILLDNFLKDFCEYVKETDIDFDFKILIIKEILETLNKFKNEENKRLLSFIIVSRILNISKNNLQNNINILDNKVINKENNINNEKISSNKWLKILNILKLEGYHALYRALENSNVKLNSNKLIINLDKNSNSYLYNKNIAFNSKNIEILETILKDELNKKIKIEYLNEEDLIDSNFKNKIVKLFDAIEE